MATLQVKGMDDDLYRALSARAVQERRSISQQVTTIIQDYLARRRGSAEETTAALLELCGTWVDDRPAEEIARDLSKARKSGGRSIDVFD
jgi:plasmid stability protein